MIFSEAKSIVPRMPLRHQTADDSPGVPFPCGDSANWMDKTFISEKPWGFCLSLLYTGCSPSYCVNCMRVDTRQQEGPRQKDSRANQAASASSQGSVPG